MGFEVWAQSPTTLAFAGAVSYIIYYLIKTYLNYRAETCFGLRHGCKAVPQLPNAWPFGLDWVVAMFKKDAQGHLLQFFSSVADEYEPRNMVSQNFLLGPRVYHVMDPINIETILSNNFQDYGLGLRHEVFAPLLGDGIFTQEGAAWKHSRELLRDQFRKMGYQNLKGFREHIDNLIAALPTEKGVVDLQPLFYGLTLDTITALLLGRSCYSLKVDANGGADARGFAKSFDAAQKGLSIRFRLAPLHFIYNSFGFRKACKVVHRFVEGYIRDHSQAREIRDDSSSVHENFMNQLEKETAGNLALRDQLLNILLAGRDTTACCLSWTVYLIVRHPRVLTRLRTEIISTQGTKPNGHIGRDELRKMSYLFTVIKESLRLFPPVPMNNRTALRTTILPRGGGPDGKSPVLIRRGELVAFGQYVIARRKNIWGPDAEDFIPERWERQGTRDLAGCAYFPFHGGPRTCLGQDFATIEVAYTIVRLLQTFPHISIPPGESNESVGDERQRVTLVLSIADGCRAELDRNA